MSVVVFSGVTKHFGNTVALDRFDLTVGSGELICLLGPSGCGKTTALRILAGFENLDEGDVTIDGSSVLATSARDRGFGMVFQSYSLFPNMTARRNIGFALQLKGTKAQAQRRRVDELLELTGLEEHADKYPHQLSGGRQQRVALARAIATEPPVLLLDEPLSALDAAVREQLRVEIRRLQRTLGITTVFVTHDQHEAMAIADRIGVMERGSLVQLGPPVEVYTAPRTAFVSSFLGTSNQVSVERNNGAVTVLGTPVTDLSSDTTVVFVRPEHIKVESHSGRGVLAVVVERWFLGALTRLECAIGDHTIIVDVASGTAEDLAPGRTVHLLLDGPVIAVTDTSGT